MITAPLGLNLEGLSFGPCNSSTKHRGGVTEDQLLAGHSLLGLGGVRVDGEDVQICGWLLPLALCDKKDRHPDFVGRRRL